MLIRRLILAAIGVCIAAAPGYSQLRSKVEDGSFGRELYAIVSSTTDPKEGLAKLEALAAKPGLTTDQRTQVEGIRVNALAALKRNSEARALAEALVKERPDLPERHLILANAAFAADDFPATAKALMAASLRQPDVVNQLPEYEIMLLANQLDSASEHHLLAAFGQRLFDAGWEKGRVGLRSTLAMDVIAELIENGRAVDANRYLPLVATPTAYSRLLTERRFEPIRKDAADWAGPHLEKQWPIYLERTKRAWLADRSPDTAADYANALKLAGHNRTLVDTFLPQLSRKLDPDADDLWIFLYPSVADSLAALGRWDETFALLDAGLKVWSVGDTANSINISGNRARLRLFKGDFALAARLFDEVLKEAEPVAVEVTPQTLALIRSYKTCAQHQAGGEDVRASAERLASEWGAREPTMVAWMEMCMGQRDEALKTLITALDNDEGRPQVLAFAQPKSDTSVDSNFARAMAAAMDSLARDPALLKAARNYGERRSWRIRDGAPAEQN